MSLLNIQKEDLVNVYINLREYINKHGTDAQLAELDAAVQPKLKTQEQDCYCMQDWGFYLSIALFFALAAWGALDIFFLLWAWFI